MPTERIIQILFGLITAIAIALASFALKWVFDANAKLAAMETSLTLKFANIDESLIELSDDTAETTRMTSMLSKHWKLHNWAKDQIAELRHQTQMPPVSWPDLD